MLYEVRILKPNKDGILHQTKRIKKEEVSERYWKNANGDKLSERTCVECNLPFEGPKKQTICTPKCKEERELKRRKRALLHQKEKRKLLPRIPNRKCRNQYCDVIFTPKRHDNVFHHPRCGNKYYNGTARDINYVRKCRTCKKDIPTDGNRLYCYDPCLPKDGARRDRKKREY